jgi:phospholipid N-methyltransferase
VSYLLFSHIVCAKKCFYGIQSTGHKVLTVSVTQTKQTTTTRKQWQQWQGKHLERNHPPLAEQVNIQSTLEQKYKHNM